MASQTIPALISKWLVALALALLPLFVQAAQQSCAMPAVIDDTWEIADLAVAGFDPAELCAAIDGVRTGKANIHGLVVVRHGKLVAEMYRRGNDRSIWSPWTKDVEFGPTVLHDMRSISKSVTGLLFGTVSRHVSIGPLTTPVLTFYPEYSDLRSEERMAITLEHLLTMSSGLAWNEFDTPYASASNHAYPISCQFLSLALDSLHGPPWLSDQSSGVSESLSRRWCVRALPGVATLAFGLRLPQVRLAR